MRSRAWRGFCFFGVTMRTNIYVDGFNLYYGALRGTPYKWLDIRRMCELLLPNHTIARIKYFTARISARPDDPGQPLRQQTYLRALRTLPETGIVYGHFLTNEVHMQQAAQILVDLAVGDLRGLAALN